MKRFGFCLAVGVAQVMVMPASIPFLAGCVAIIAVQFACGLLWQAIAEGAK